MKDHSLIAAPSALFVIYIVVLVVGSLFCSVAFWLPMRNRGRLFRPLFGAGFGLVVLGLALILADYLLL